MSLEKKKPNSIKTLQMTLKANGMGVRVVTGIRFLGLIVFWLGEEYSVLSSLKVLNQKTFLTLIKEL